MGLVTLKIQSVCIPLSCTQILGAGREKVKRMDDYKVDETVELWDKDAQSARRESLKGWTMKDKKDGEKR